MMILPLADALQNTLQNLTSRIAGVDNEQMTGRAMGMGTALGYSIGAMKEQFKTPAENIKNGNSNNETSNSGFKGFISKAKSVVNPSVNLSEEKDYNGNINPIRNNVQNEKLTMFSKAPVSSIKSDENSIKSKNLQNLSNSTGVDQKIKTIATNTVKAGVSGAKTYVSVGAKMAEGNFNSNSYQSRNNHIYKKNSQNVEYINNNLTNKTPSMEEGEKNEYKGKG